jgi:hypothetical protein
MAGLGACQNYTFVRGWHIAIAEQLNFSLLGCSSEHHLCFELFDK